MLLLISACYGLIPKDPTHPEKEQYINFRNIFDNIKSGFSNQLNDGFDTSHTYDVTDEDSSLSGYDAETRYFADPNVIDVDKLLLDKTLRTSLGVNGRKFVTSKYNWNNCIELMIAAYRLFIKTPCDKNNN